MARKRIYRRKFKRSRPRLRFSRKQQQAILKITKRAHIKMLDNWWEIGFNDSLSTSPTFTHCTAIPQGDDNANLTAKRQGNEISVRSISFKGYLTYADSTNIVRVIWFIWNGKDTPTSANILDTTTSSASAINAHYTMENDSNFNSKYRILYDKRFRVDSSSTPQRLLTFRKKFKYGHNVEFYNTSATQYKFGTIWCLAVSDSSAVSHPNMYGTFRCKFGTTVN